jgi:hypothetical protein
MKKGYPLNPAMRAAILAQLPADLPNGNKTPRPASPIVGARGQPLAALERTMQQLFKEVCSDKHQKPEYLVDQNGVLHHAPLPPVSFDTSAADTGFFTQENGRTGLVVNGVLLPPPGDTGEESISAQEEMRMACAWLMSLDESDAAAALAVIRTMREGYTP